MSAATLTRPVRALPGPKAGALVAPHHDPRPCVTNPPQWWDTGHKRNRDAIDLCNNTCPLKDHCALTTGKPQGQIVAGIAYGDGGKRLNVCDTCHQPMLNGSFRGGSQEKRCDACRVAAVAIYHEQIVALRAGGASYATVGRALNLSEYVVRHYCDRHVNQQEAAA